MVGNIITKKIKRKIGNDDYEVFISKFKGKTPHSYVVKRNGVWFNRDYQNKTILYRNFPKLKGKI